jgi:Na+-translocating ferredoxin:NAD+ oxidoreductase RnfG subunit
MVVYSTEEEALKKMMPEADHFDVEEVHLSPDQLSRAQELAGKAFREGDYRFTIGRKGTVGVAYALKLDAIGKERPITFLIGIEPSGEVRGIELLIYRESEGSDIRHPRFMKQFFKKKGEDPLRLGQDIQPISGATLSSRAATYAVRKALSIFEVVYKKKAEPR